MSTPPTRARALDAAVALVGEQGIRALTHARVDAAAGLPAGSTSNWFRTRDALVTGVIAWIAEQERAELDATLGPADSADELVDALCTMLERATVQHAVRTRARYALVLETTADAQAPLRVERSRFEEWMRNLLARLGADDPDTAARSLLAFAGGLIVHRVTVAPDLPLRPTVEVAVRGCLAPKSDAAGGAALR